MTLLKNFIAFVVLVFSVVMIGCQSGADEAREEARESLEQPAEGAIAPQKVNAGDQPSAVAAENTAPAGPVTVMSFDHKDYDFGTVKEGEKVAHTYTFKNTGKEPLIISSAKGSCGCTVPKWPSEPIAPGASGTIDVVFDSKGKPGKQAKRVTVNANTEPAQTFLNISGVVEKDPNAPEKSTTPAK